MPGIILIPDLNVNDSFSSKSEYSDHHFKNGPVARYSDHHSNYGLVFWILDGPNSKAIRMVNGLVFGMPL